MVPLILPLLTLGATLASAQIAATGSAATAAIPATRISSARLSSRAAAATATGVVSATTTSVGSASVTTSAAATASPSSTLPATAVLETYEPAEPQAWCPAGTYCSGDILQTVELAKIFPDSKTFPDKPTRLSLNETLAAWEAAKSNGTFTVGDLEEFVNEYFTAEGQELTAVQIASSFNASAPTFLQSINDTVVRGFIVEVIGYWSELIRETNTSALCGAGSDCDSSLIPLNHTVVVPGGRYREVYYWDSFWIVEGLLHSGLSEYARDILDNFMDQLDLYGFIPNGGRKYYLNRSQPPVFIQMLDVYVKFTNDTSILERALPLADVELQWWQTNRSLEVTSPWTNKTHNVYNYNVFLNTAPRPEGYVEDWNTVNLAEPALNTTQAEDLYIELASGAESGWDYSARWIREPFKNLTDPLAGLRSLAVRETIPIELNALLASDHYIVANLYDQYAKVNASSAGNATSKADLHYQQGDSLKEALMDLFWDSDKVAFYDYNTTSEDRNDFFSAAAYYPFWLNLIPEELEKDEQKLFQAFSGLNLILETYNGSVPCTLTEAGLNWDFPNAWPPHQYIITKALDNLPTNVTSTPYSTFRPANYSAFDLIPDGQLGHVQADLPVQGGVANGTTIALGDRPADGTISIGESWRDVLRNEVINRYIGSTFCSWYSTGGYIPGVLTQLSAAELNVTNATPESTGKMFEKFNGTDLDAAGGGGEYEVVTGFGWTNGVLIWMGATFPEVINFPECPMIEVAPSASNSTSGMMAGARKGRPGQV